MDTTLENIEAREGLEVGAAPDAIALVQQMQGLMEQLAESVQQLALAGHDGAAPDAPRATNGSVAQQATLAQNERLKETIRRQDAEIKQLEQELAALKAGKAPLPAAPPVGTSGDSAGNESAGSPQMERELANTRAALIQSDKMATLGRLVAGITHELNTPLGAVNASHGFMDKSLQLMLESLPRKQELVTADIAEIFEKLVQDSLNVNSTLSSREERELIKNTTALLEENGVENARGLARELVFIGLKDDLMQYMPIFKHPQGEDILKLASLIGKFRVNVNNVGLAVQKMQKLITALKTFSHKNDTEKPVEVNLEENIKMVLAIYHNQLKYAVNVQTQFGPNVPTIVGWPDELNQVWTNLIHNSLQAMKNEGDLFIDLERDGDYVVVRIADSGPGIPEHVLPRIFEPFFTTKPAGEGTGLGLDIVKQIVDRHQGSIAVESVPGRTAFSIRLPILLKQTA